VRAFRAPQSNDDVTRWNAVVVFTRYSSRMNLSWSLQRGTQFLPPAASVLWRCGDDATVLFRLKVHNEAQRPAMPLEFPITFASITLSALADDSHRFGGKSIWDASLNVRSRLDSPAKMSSEARADLRLSALLSASES
jgi:hypothetical protein